MKITIAQTGTYVPKWNRNRDLPAAEQMQIEYQYMTAEQEEKYVKMVPRYKGEEVTVDFDTNVNAIWDECVLSVRNFCPNGKEMSDAKEVRKLRGIYSLITEVVAHIKQGLTDDESKN
jgi:predicted extracellular nuclease